MQVETGTERRQPSKPRMRRLTPKKRLWICVAALAATSLMAAAAWAAYWFSPALLTIDSGECRADVIVVLGGEPYGRPTRAAELFKAGAAPVIIVSGEGDCLELARALKVNGVPESAIRTECESRSTKENAELTLRLLKTIQPNQPSASQLSTLNSQHVSVILVTSWYHSRRALKCFQKTAPDFHFYSRPSYYAFARSDWSRTGFSRHIRAEFLKIPAYAVLYGVWPW